MDYLSLLHLLRVQLVFGLILLLLPVLALTKARSLLANLFDLCPGKTFFAVLTALALSWSIMLSGYVVVRHTERFGPQLFDFEAIGPGWDVAALFAVAALPTVLGIRKRGPDVWSNRHILLTGCAIVVSGGLGSVAVKAADYVIPMVQRSVPVNATSPVLRGYLDGTQVSAVHILAAFGFFTATAVYFGLMFFPRPRVPTLAYVYTWLSILCWGGAALAFFLDMYRVPLALTVLALLLYSGYVYRSKTDHYFGVVKCLDDDPPKPGEVLDAHPGEPAIVVAANGGGIQSAAWTARVLAGLDARWRQHNTNDPDRFRRSIRLISGVSGGSVGAMNYLETWNGVSPEQAVTNSKTSSLADVAWGLVYPDFLALVLLPLPRNVDRGNELERSWVRTVGNSLRQPLSFWYHRVRRGECPAVMYNATITETGERLLMGTTSITQRDGDGRRNLSEVLHGCDVASVTAARLSASFPFVTPVARPDDGKPRGYHIADGGYYDNYGTVTAVEWLDEALQNTRVKPSRVLLLEIHGAPAAEEPGGSNRGWAYQLFAPISCMLNVRTAGQHAHKTLETEFLEQIWANSVPIDRIVMCFRGKNPPLSWHLSEAEKQAIDLQFEASHSDWHRVRSWLEDRPAAATA